MTELLFKGKEFVYNHHLSVPFRPLEPIPDKSVGDVDLSGNLIIHGDNLHALKALLPMYAGKIDCIFIDPPYNTGNEGWSYNDNVNSPMLKEWFGKEVGIEDALRHDKWCAMMWPRLRLLHELLSEEGFIFVCIDQNELQRLRHLMDEIFGEENFRNEIVFRRGIKNVQSKFDDIHALSVGHDNLLLYSRSPDARLRKLSNESETDEPGKWDTFWRGTDRPTMRYDLFGQLPSTGQWRWSEARARSAASNYWEYLSDYQDLMQLDDYYHLRTQELGTKCDFVRLNEEGVIQYFVPPRNFKLMSDVWLRLRAKGNETDFEHEKHVELVRTVLSWATHPNSVVLDSFAGSGTTGHAVMDVNAKDGGSRKYLLVEMEDYADSLTAERIRKTLRSEEHQPQQDEDGFTFCRLSDPIELNALLNGEDLPSFESLAAVLFHMATTAAFDPGKMETNLFGKPEHGYLGADGGRHIWLIYAPDLDFLKSNEAALTLSTARAMAERAPADRHIVYAPSRFVSQKILWDESIPVEYAPLPLALYRLPGADS